MSANGFYNNNYAFVQGKDTIAIWVEMVHDTRVVRLNAKHRTDGVRQFAVSRVTGVADLTPDAT